MKREYKRSDPLEAKKTLDENNDHTQDDQLRLEGPAIDNVLDVLKSEETKATYLHRMKQYLEHRGFKSPQDMLKGDPASIQKDVIDYLKHLKLEKHLAYASRQVSLAMFRKFYAQNDVILNWDKIHNYLGEHEKTIEDRAYTREEIRKLLEVAGLRGRVLILLLASSGLRRGAVPGIKRKHMKFIPEQKVFQITTYPKSKERYVAFCSPECAKEIEAYFAYRQECGEKLDDESPLIREEFDTDSKEKASKPHAANKHALKMILVRCSKVAGIKAPHQKHDDGRPTQRTEVMLSHGLRKYFDTALANAGLHAVKMAALMGHKEGLQRSYLRPKDEELLAEYVKAINELTISDENKLRVQVFKLQAEKNDLIDLLKNRVAALERGHENQALLEGQKDKLPIVESIATGRRKQRARRTS